MKWPVLLLAAIMALGLAACGGRGTRTDTGAAPVGRFKPIDPAAAVFWDRQTTESAELLRKIAEEFNADRGGRLPIKVEHTGGYNDIFRKVSASIQAGALPSMAVGYQSMTAEYAQAGAVIALDDLVKDPDAGLGKDDLDDFFPAILESNTYPDLGGKLYSFPFCKSVLMLYFNKRVLSQAGVDRPPKTWIEFLDACRAVKEKTGKMGYAVSVDCSAIAGMIFSEGGQVVSGKQTLFDAPASRRVFELIETLAKEKLAYQITPGAYDDEAALAQDNVAFAIRSSSGRTNVGLVMQNEQDKWGMAMIPQSDPEHPKTVLFGPNICVFDTTPDQQRAAWDFVKHFTSKEVSIRWALGTGYVPIRKSAADDPRIQKFWAEWPYNRAAFDCLAHAMNEPNLAGWQEVRSLVEHAETQVLTGTKSAQEAVQELKQKADAVLARS